jgi:hypothetical protein
MVPLIGQSIKFEASDAAVMWKNAFLGGNFIRHVCYPVIHACIYSRSECRTPTNQNLDRIL